MKALYMFCVLMGFIIGGVQKTMMYAAAEGNVASNQNIHVETTTKTYSCACDYCTCNFYISAVGDLRDIAVTAKEATLGSITQTRTVTLNIPTIGKQVLYSFMTTVPYSSSVFDEELVGKKIFFLFISEKPDAAMIKQNPLAQAMTKVYRRLASETLWTEVATLAHEGAIANLPALSVSIEANGDVSWMEGAEKMTISIGKGIIG
jgi:hypothetical protein